ncbi:MAG: FAD-dependent oxidoreductase [Sulfuricurvum sp.]|jgi:succinate dehydrogenase / fumarate reductase flavoprotein subunit|uniref:FAD-dependent oxidoreductase n=1 Tax=Sulfuricurvum sp. TaxID=2025608 RepID=UPI0025F1D245|nr:FAD-dependent oxidoreductase [Sulfuricurvum sp.]MCK9371946.1 FAD-dependent oxidoreductase [Sulfuricurvum sp.]
MARILIIGGGGAGLVSALSAQKSGAEVMVVSKTVPTRSQTSMAQGGMNAVLGGEDTIARHIEETLRSGAGLGEEERIAFLCENAPDAVRWCNLLGLPFSCDAEGEIARRRLGGASAPRACHAQDYTGLKLLHTLYDQCLKAGIAFRNERFLLNLIVDHEENRVVGATFLDIASGEVEEIRADAVILATGGYGAIYGKHSTNAVGSSGDGLAAAVRAGAKLADMEFIQFHPTALKNSSILISESARGAGGYLVDEQGDRFTDELAPRDVVARAIHDEISKSGGVYLDIRHLGEEFINHELPQERKLARIYEGVDPVNDLIPIKPSAHYSMGGIEVNEACMSSVKGLFAVGECANHKTHGANRLGGNSLLELVVFGRHCGAKAAEYGAKNPASSSSNPQLAKDTNFVRGVMYFTNQIDFYQKQEMLANIFYNNVGLVRDDMGLKAVLGAIRQMQKELPFMGPRDKSKVCNTNLVEFIEFGNKIELAEIIVVSAISRVESRGAHYRVDAPVRNDRMFGAHTVTWKEEGVLCADFME